MTLTDLLVLLGRLGAVASSEADGFSELDHALQCAHVLSLARPADAELQVAGLVHDIGHQFGGDEAHGRLGARAVRGVLGPRVAGLVEAHVAAKRYLVATDPSYAGSALSAVSARSLVEQGGALADDERAAFAASPWFADALVLRRADDAAKVAGRWVPPLDAWIALVEGVAQA